jgi:hypothetical protein
LRKDLVHLRKLQEEVHLLGRRRIGTMEELDAYDAEQNMPAEEEES